MSNDLWKDLAMEMITQTIIRNIAEPNRKYLMRLIDLQEAEIQELKEEVAFLRCLPKDSSAGLVEKAETVLPCECPTTEQESQEFLPIIEDVPSDLEEEGAATQPLEENFPEITQAPDEITQAPSVKVKVCKFCGENNQEKFYKSQSKVCKDCLNKPKSRPNAAPVSELVKEPEQVGDARTCVDCGETDESKFYLAGDTRCKKCKNKRANDKRRFEVPEDLPPAETLTFGTEYMQPEEAIRYHLEQKRPLTNQQIGIWMADYSLNRTQVRELIEKVQAKLPPVGVHSSYDNTPPIDFKKYDMQAASDRIVG